MLFSASMDENVEIYLSFESPVQDRNWLRAFIAFTKQRKITDDFFASEEHTTLDGNFWRLKKRERYMYAYYTHMCCKHVVVNDKFCDKLTARVSLVVDCFYDFPELCF